ncbi:colicin immunity domain-containing protein [Kitasatospora sp. MMS16-BH015]|uniref:colicin immunity domain-containing protein n=1 Tax=Kitasatospora sp. MMS16-BH015 TaxID=2018025 RepID=UPI000CF2345E|nr:colicin immunity domain-containing protein [Kitasatospora sp. MMS16-BH015]
MAGQLDSYVIVARALVESRMSAQEFETVFLSIFRGEGDMFSDAETRALHSLFLDVDSYCSNPDLRDTGDLDDDGLIESARKFLDAVHS